MKPIIILGWMCLALLTTAHSQPRTSEALFPVNQNSKLGYIDTTGKFVIAPQFTGAGKFCDGLAPVRVSEKWGYIDEQGKIAINSDFHEARPFSEGRAAVKKGKNWGYIEKSGKFVVAAKFDEAARFSQGLASVKRDEKWGYINIAGKLVAVFQFDEAFIFSDNRALVGIGDKYGYIDRAGRPVIKPEFDWAGTFNNKLALVEKNDTLSYIDSTGTSVFDVPFDDAGDFSEGLAPIQVGYAWGYIDTTGEIVIAPQFHEAGPFSEGLAMIRLRDKVGFIDKTGEYVIKPGLDFAGNFGNGLAVVGVGETEGYMDKSGRLAFQTNNTFEASKVFVAIEKLIISFNPDPATQPPNFVPYERAPEIIKRANPQYSNVAMKAGIEGVVSVKLWVDKRGKVRRVIIQHSDGEMLNPPAAEAARQFEFKPATIKGKPVGVWVSIPFHFQLIDLTTSSSEPEVSMPSEETPPPGFVPFVSVPQIIKKVDPIYPAIARKAGLEGKVWLKIWVDKTGMPRKIVIQKSASEIFDQPAIDAAKQLVFTPARMQLRPIDAWVSVPFQFRLRDGAKIVFH